MAILEARNIEMRDEDKYKQPLIEELKELHQKNSTDITRREQIENQLRCARQYSDAFLFNVPIGVDIMAGKDFECFRINQILADFNGLTVEAQLGKPLAEVLPHASNILPYRRKVRENGQVISNREFSAILPKNPEKTVYLADWHFPIFVNGKQKLLALL